MIVIQGFGLLVGWRWYFQEVEARRTIIDLAAKEEARVVAMGISVPKPASSSAGMLQEAPAVPLAGIVPGQKNLLNSSAAIPAASEIRELLLESIADEVSAAEALVSRYRMTPHWEDRLPLVRDANRVKRLMQTYYEGQGGVDPMPGALQGKGRFMIDETEVLHFSYESARPSGLLEVALVRDVGGAFRLDWESCVGFGEKTFVQLRLQRPEEPVVLRVMVTPDDYYNFEFDDPDRFICVKLVSPDGGYSLFGYAERTGAVGGWLERELAGRGGMRGLTVQVAYPPNAQSDQCLEIRRIIADRWLVLP